MLNNNRLNDTPSEGLATINPNAETPYNAFLIRVTLKNRYEWVPCYSDKTARYLANRYITHCDDVEAVDVIDNATGEILLTKQVKIVTVRQIETLWDNTEEITAEILEEILR